MTDGLSTLYQDLLGGSYDCVDRIVLNAYFRMGHSPGGFRVWWRAPPRRHCIAWASGWSRGRLDDRAECRGSGRRIAGRLAEYRREWKDPAVDQRRPLHLLLTQYLIGD